MPPVLGFHTHLVPAIVVQQQREDLLPEVIVLVASVLTAVDENVVFARVCVEVSVHDYAVLVYQSVGTNTSKITQM